MLKSEPTSPYKKAILYDSGLKQDTFFALTFFSIIRETYKPATFCLRTENSKI